MRHLDGGSRTRVKMPRRRRRLLMNYLPSRDLRCKSSLTMYIDLNDGSYKWVETTYGERTDEEDRKTIWGIAARNEKKKKKKEESEKDGREATEEKQPRRPQRPRAHPVTARYSGTSPSLLYKLFLFYSLVFRSPDLLLYCASQFGRSAAATIRDSYWFRDIPIL